MSHDAQIQVETWQVRPLTKPFDTVSELSPGLISNIHHKEEVMVSDKARVVCRLILIRLLQSKSSMRRACSLAMSPTCNVQSSSPPQTGRDASGTSTLSAQHSNVLPLSKFSLHNLHEHMSGKKTVKRPVSVQRCFCFSLAMWF